MLKKVKAACQEYIDRCDDCMRDNKSDPMACIPFVQDVFFPGFRKLMCLGDEMYVFSCRERRR